MLRTEDSAPRHSAQNCAVSMTSRSADVTKTYGEHPSTSEHWVRRTRPRIPESVFLTIPPASPRYGISGYGLSPYLAGYVWSFNLSGPWVKRHVPGAAPFLPGLYSSAGRASDSPAVHGRRSSAVGVEAFALRWSFSILPAAASDLGRRLGCWRLPTVCTYTRVCEHEPLP